MPSAIPQIQIRVFESALDVAPTIIDALKSDEAGANCVMPTLLKSRLAEARGEVPPQKQVWVACSSLGGSTTGLELLLSVTEGYIGSYPVFLYSAVPSHALTQDFLQPRMYQMVHALLRTVSLRRVYSVFGPDLLANTFAWAWTDVTGIQNYNDKPYYAAKISFCTRQTFRNRSITIQPDLCYEIRPANANDIMEIAEHCFGFAADSDPFFLTKEAAIREATILVQRNQVWVHRIARRGNPRSEIASIVAFTRNSETNATITKVHTNPNWRRLGCAERLVREVCSFLLRTKMSVALFVAHDNPGAAHVYSRVGFVGLSPPEGPVPGVESWSEIGFDRSRVQLGHW